MALKDDELQAPPHLTIDTLTSHAESTSSTLLYALLSMLSLPSDTLSHAASHIGVTQTFATLIRGLPFHASRGQMIIPAEITAKHGVNQEGVFRLASEGPRSKGEAADGNKKGLEDAVFEFATVANDHLITARDMFKETAGKVPVEGMPVFLSGVRIILGIPYLLLTKYVYRSPSRTSSNVWKK